jgi:hypothetical protein
LYSRAAPGEVEDDYAHPPRESELQSRSPVAPVIGLQYYRAPKFAADRHDRRRWMMRKLSAIFILAVLIAFAVARPARAADVICYNCPPQWADFASMLKAVKADLGYDIPFDNKNSGQALSQIIAEKRYCLLRRQFRHESENGRGHRRIQAGGLRPSARGIEGS